MGRTYMVDGSVQLTLNKLIESSGNDWSIGLVIGQFSTQRDYVVHVAATPRFEPPSTVETSEAAGDGSSSSGTVVRSMRSESRNSLSLGKSLDMVNEKQVVNHVRQANRMLTGGLDILGIFVIASPDEMKTAQSKLRQVLYAVHRFLSKSEPRLNSTNHSDRVLLQLCSLTKKFTCRTFDASDSKSSGNPAEWKVLKSAESFTEVTSQSYSLDTVIPVQNSSLSFSLQKQVVNGLGSLFDNVQDSLAVIGGRLVTELSAPLSNGGAGEQPKGKNRKQVENASLDHIKIDLLGALVSSGTSAKAAVIDCGARMCVRGSVATKAFVHSKSVLGNAVDALKVDIIRSLTARCELLCEDLLSAEEDQDLSVVYETPIRVFVALPGVPPIRLCDYLFQDETAANAAERFRELLGLEVEEEDVDCSAECIPDEKDLDFPGLNSSGGHESNTGLKDATKTSTKHHTNSDNAPPTFLHWVLLIASLLALVIGVYFFPSS